MSEDTNFEFLKELLEKLSEDTKYIIDRVDTNSERINDLCIRTTLNEQKLKDEIKHRVRSETSKYKFITIFFTSIGSLVSAFTSLKSVGVLH